MKAIRWVLVAGLATTSIAGAILGSCAIDDDITWITGENCTVNCRSDDPASYSCDTDAACTPTLGCTDWDCADEEAPPTDAVTNPDGGGTDADASRDAAAPDEGGDATSGDGGDADVTPPAACAPYGGGETRDTAETLTLGETLAELGACTAPSRWFRFTVPAGARFEVLIRTAPAESVEFLLYAEDGSVVASAGMTDDSSYSANAATGATYLMRVRAAEGSAGAVWYGLTVQLIGTP
jgi:hypothetical protein